MKSLKDNNHKCQKKRTGVKRVLPFFLAFCLTIVTSGSACSRTAFAVGAPHTEPARTPFHQSSSGITVNDDGDGEAAAGGRNLNAGDRMPDGTVYAGISPDTHERMYTTSSDAPLTYTF